ncbi:hypothetical protein LVJ94_02740 [Pendulispora rubella]|uniref:Uncharacterized protein n=1 Tax=Pendulispora rubella TaxID=2741070 RepID=A0ABZ2L9D4_9BACT
MPKILSETPSFEPAVSVPIDADPGNALSVEVPFQQLANHSRYLRNELDYVAPAHQGVRQLRTLRSLKELHAVPASHRTDNQVVLVPGYGLFTWQPAAIGDDTPWSIRPADIPASGPGRWQVDFSARPAAADGLATLDAGGRLHPSQRPTWLVGIHQREARGNNANAYPEQPGGVPPQEGTYVAFIDAENWSPLLSGVSIPEPKQGDLLTIELGFNLYLHRGVGAVRVAIHEGNAVDRPDELHAAGSASTTASLDFLFLSWQRLFMSYRYVLRSSNVPCSVDLEAECRDPSGPAGSKGALYVMRPFILRVRQERP